MLIFIDTEFTDFTDPELISIGLVSECGKHELYLENSDYSLSQCSEFVRSNVLPQLGKRPDAQCRKSEMRERLLNWMEKFRHHDSVVIGYDYDGDWTLFCAALGNDVPAWIGHVNIWERINEFVVETYFRDTGLPDHHALHDAHANRFAYMFSSCRVDRKT